MYLIKDSNCDAATLPSCIHLAFIQLILKGEECVTKRKFNLPNNNDNNTEKILKATTITCTGACGKDKAPSNYYVTTNPLYKSTGRFPVCKRCITDRLPDYRINSQNELYKVIQDRSFVSSVLSLLKSMNYPFLLKQWTIAINEAEKTGKHIFGLYMKHLSQVKEALNHDDGDKNLSSDDICRLSINRGMTPEVLEEVKNDEKKKSRNKLKFDDSELTITEEDLSAQKDVIRLLGYDPFVDYNELDRKYMYQEITPFLDEDTLEDQHLISVITQMVISNSQIKKIDNAIATLSKSIEDLKENSGEIDKLAGIKKKIQESVTKLATENSIAVKHRTDKKQGRSTLGYMMKELREYDFKDAEENYYDINKSKGMQVTAELSVKAIFDQLHFSESDYEDMLKEQRTMIERMQNQITELEEEIRVCNVQLDTYKSQFGDLEDVN